VRAYAPVVRVGGELDKISLTNAHRHKRCSIGWMSLTKELRIAMVLLCISTDEHQLTADRTYQK